MTTRNKNMNLNLITLTVGLDVIVGIVWIIISCISGTTIIWLATAVIWIFILKNILRAIFLWWTMGGKK